MILALTPLQFENEALRSPLGPCTGETEVDGIKLRHFGQILLATGGHGKVQFALTAQRLCLALSPKLLVCAGSAGALTSGSNKTDVIAAEATIEHDFNLRFEKRPLPRFPGDPTTLQTLKARSAWPGFQLHFGTIASGDEDILDASRAAAVYALTESLAVAWEGAGGARAARFCHTPYLELRAITDAADASTKEDFLRHMQAGMKNVAQVLLALRDPAH